MTKQIVNFVANGNNEVIEKFINFIMLDGKKTVARRLLKETFEIVQKKTGEKSREVFDQALENIKPSLEVRPKRIGGSVYQIPREVKPRRQFQLASRWILAAARSKKGTNFASSLASEIIQAANNEGAAIKKKEDSHRMAQANKAFAHFAKY
jgi:small subunit ribosomal protein S7